MSEQTTRQKLLQLIKVLDPVAVENLAGPGTPDVNYCEGWIELKEKDNWGLKGCPVLLDHYTPQQRIFLRKRWAAGGHTYLLLKVKQEWLLFGGDIAHSEVGFVPRERLLDVALCHWKQTPPAEELIAFLKTPRKKLKK